jgi:DNA modification methylase
MPRGQSNLLNRYHICDARNLADLLPPHELIDVTITSPPYWNLKDYGFARQIGFGQPYHKYLADLKTVFDTVLSTTKPTGSLWIVADTLKLNGELTLLPFDLATALRQTGWILQDIIIWQKDRTLPWSHQGKLRNIFEYIVFFTKSRHFKYNVSRIRDILDLKNYWVRYPERYSPDGKAPSRAWHIPIPRQGSWGKMQNYVRHACPLPPPLIERILDLTTDPGDLVLDPFAGSGSVLAQADVMGRRFIGTDLSQSYKQMFEVSVNPAFVKLRGAKNGAASEAIAGKRKFSTLIRALRCVKYPRELIRLYRKWHTRPGCVGVLALRDRPGHLSITLLFPSRARIPACLLCRLRVLSMRPPLSKYGIRAVVATCAMKREGEMAAAKGLTSKRRLHVYRDGNCHRAVGKITARELWREVDAGRPGNAGRRWKYPPIFSNIYVAIDSRKPESALEVVDGSR